jgi:hypothetical protein
MTRRTPALPLARRLARWALLAAVAAFGLIPAGVMPGRAADGGLALVICTGKGPAALALDAATGEPAEPSPDRCLWSLVHPPALPVGWAAAPAPADLPRAAPRPPAAAPARALRPFRPQLPRGPPLPA